MAADSLTPGDYELHLKDLREKLTAFIERGEGNPKALHREAEAVLALADQFAEIYGQYPEIEGMVADLLARERQLQVFGTGREQEAPGCMLGWLLRSRPGGSP
ncbi:MAG: hypothetical protein AMK73_02320 [Planctomycetes bacterium SM23_32]|nr:MAG: hypothetical protein AMK73_02320 [Planctomycetes bacterium SM23_32]